MKLYLFEMIVLSCVRRYCFLGSRVNEKLMTGIWMVALGKVIWLVRHRACNCLRMVGRCCSDRQLLRPMESMICSGAN